ncbi:hypothetical protein Afil01_53000 [Actinorhabdospora filicis]|uniref:Uncharacterized protein n=1 Tax=Actinorhabdospora filicis TaxID=1785913 RepID=A0A9W6SQH7_9ACTN|nr:hypothetical protein Afil01_53000 [Actinorhabdospora filicis]
MQTAADMTVLRIVLLLRGDCESGRKMITPQWSARGRWVKARWRYGDAGRVCGGRPDRRLARWDGAGRWRVE